MLIILEILLEAHVSFHDVLAYSAYFFLIWGERERDGDTMYICTYTDTYMERDCISIHTWPLSLHIYLCIYIYICTVSLSLSVCLSVSVSLSLSLSIYIIYIVSQSILAFRQIFSMFLYSYILLESSSLRDNSIK